MHRLAVLNATLTHDADSTSHYQLANLLTHVQNLQMHFTTLLAETGLSSDEPTKAMRTIGSHLRNAMTFFNIRFVATALLLPFCCSFVYFNYRCYKAKRFHKIISALSILIPKKRTEQPTQKSPVQSFDPTTDPHISLAL